MKATCFTCGRRVESWVVSRGLIRCKIPCSPIGDQTMVATAEEKAVQNAQLEKDRERVRRMGGGLIEDMADRALTPADRQKIRAQRAILVAAQRQAEEARETYDRAKKVRDEEQRALNETLAEFFPVPAQESDPDQGKLGFDGPEPSQNGSPDGATPDADISSLSFITTEMRSRLRVAGISSVADLEKAIEADPTWHEKIKGIGQKKAERIADAMRKAIGG